MFTNTTFTIAASHPTVWFRRTLGTLLRDILEMISAGSLAEVAS
jgi:hypothetical protein